MSQTSQHCRFAYLFQLQVFFSVIVMAGFTNPLESVQEVPRET